MTAVTALSVVIMLTTTGLAINARNARLTAEQRQREAETLIDFMLGDLNNKLRQVQRLDILEAVDNKAIAYFLAHPSTGLTDQALALHVKALQKIGNVREDQGKLPEAMGAYRAAAAAAAELMRRTPGDAEREAVYAETLQHLGNAYWFQGDLSRALECFQQASVLLQRAVAVRPSDDRSALLAYARTNEGRVHEARGEFAAAKSLYGAVLATFRTLTSEHPREIQWQSGLADAAQSLAKVSMEQGELTQAIAEYRDVYRIRNQIMAEGKGAGKAFWRPPPFAEHRGVLAGVVAAAILVVVLLNPWYSGRPSPQEPRVARSVAANRTSTLPDGSMIDLGGRTSVAVDFSGPARRLRLSPGEAFFKVRPDKTRPFVVRAGPLDVTAVGTAFDVKHAPDRVIVTVQQGLVGITSVNTSAKQIPESGWQVRAGDQFTYSEVAATATLASVDTSSALAWRAGRLEYMNAPLPLVVADVNRYSSHPLEIADPQLEQLTFTGTVFTDAIDSWLNALPAALPVVLEHGTRGTIQLRAAPGERASSERR